MEFGTSNENYVDTEVNLKRDAIKNDFSQYDENSKFATFDESKLDNCFSRTDFKAFQEEVISIASYLKQFNELVNGVLNFDSLVNKALFEFNFSREKILIHTFFTERIVLLTYRLISIQLGKEGLNQEIEEMSIFPDIKLCYSMLSNEEIEALASSTDQHICQNKVLDITVEDSEANKARIFELILVEQKIIEKASDKSHLSSITGMLACLKYLHVVLDDISGIFKMFKIDIINSVENKPKKVFYHEEALNLFSYYWRLKNIQSFIGEAFHIDHTDIFNKSICSDEWKKILGNSETIFLYSQMTMRSKVKKLVDMVILGSAFVSKSLQIEEGIMRTLGTGLYMTQYFFSKKRASKQAKIFNTSPNIEVARSVWNLLDTKGIRIGLKLAMTSIQYRKKYYFRRIKAPITYEYLQELRNKIHNKQSLNEYLNTKDSRYDYLEEIDLSSQLLASSLSDSEKPKYIKIKLLHTSNIITDVENKNPGFFNNFGCTNCRSNKNYTRDALIIHIHGGGFVAMSSTSHENYLRKWSKSLDAPIISIDYRLAPEHPYPSALDDVYQAYCFILKYALSELMIELNKIILVGDSAGGSLAMGLMNILISKGHRTPDALFLIYPCLRVESTFFSPSKILALKDQILSMSFMMLCKEAYYGENNVPNEDYFINPINTPDHILKYYPKNVKIFGGTSDPLRDDSIRLLLRLLDNKIEAKLYEFKYFPHGFISYDLPAVIPEAADVYPYILKEMENVISSTE